MPKTKTVGILTTHRSNNYGAVLQVYALTRFIAARGFDAFVVNYHLDVPTVGAYLRNPVAFLGKLKGKGALSPAFLKAKLAEIKGRQIESDFAEIFEDFRLKHLNITPEVYDFERLAAAPPEAFAFIVGSDQVWSADFVFSSPAYLLAFAPRGSRRISYAASFGKASLEPYLRQTFRKHIIDFDSVSVREKSGVDLVRDLTGIEPFHALDPTLLLTDYREIVDYSLVPEGDFILTYRLGQEVGLSQQMDESLKAISKAMDLPLYSVSTNSVRGSVAVGKSLRPTPGQLLGLIERSRLFVTNSFHGTVFALLFRSDFLTFARDSAIDKQNLRMTELLSKVSLEQCFCSPDSETADIVRKIEVYRDFDRALAILDRYRSESVAFLDGALG